MTGLVPAIHAPAALPRPLPSRMPGTSPAMTRWGGVGCHPPIVISTGAVRSTAQRRNLAPARTRFLHSAPGGAPVEMTAWGESRPAPRPLPSRMPGTSPGMTAGAGAASTGTGGLYTLTVSTSRARKALHARIWSRLTNSSGWWASLTLPGPQTMDGTPASANSPASQV